MCTNTPLTIDITQMIKVGIIHFFHKAQVIFEGPFHTHATTMIMPKTHAAVPKTA